MTNDRDDVVSNQPPHQVHRKVSISSDHGHDNLGFESPRSRKVSSTSEHAEMGPVRKKSILHNSHAFENENTTHNHDDIGKHVNGDARKKKESFSDSVHSKGKYDADDGERSWWYSFCVKCRSKESHPSWQPAIWQRLCPYPFCLTYRQFSRIIALTLIGVLIWAVAYAIMGKTAAPGGHLFQIILLTICAHFGGWLMSLTTLPALVGMLFTGLLFQNVGIVDIDSSFSEITRELRKFALVIILTRAGLDLDPGAFKRLKLTIAKIGLGPWFVEAIVMTVASHYFLGLPWDWGLLLGVVFAAVSPAVVVPCLFRLRSKGYGVAKGIPTLIIAIAGIDDAFSVAGYGIIRSIIFSNSSLTTQILQGPICIFGGIGFGILWGAILSFAPEKHDPFVVPLRVILLLVGGLIAVYGSELIGFEGAGPLGCVAAAFAALVFWSRQGWDVEDNPAATAFEIFWMIFEPILFGITGAQVKFAELDMQIVTIALGCLALAVVLRMISTVLIGIGCKLNLKEKIFVAIACMAKATVQAVLGPLTLAAVSETHPQKEYAEKMLVVCILCIICTAPTGAILITLSGTRLLNKTRIPHVPEGWRRSHRPSIRDISIIDEEDEDDKVVHIESSPSLQKPTIKRDP